MGKENGIVQMAEFKCHMTIHGLGGQLFGALLKKQLSSFQSLGMVRLTV